MPAQKFKYVATKNALMPYAPIFLSNSRFSAQAIALVDSGSEISVLPYSLGLKLGFVWEVEKATISLGGALTGTRAMGVLVIVTIPNLDPVELFFAWSASETRLILGQTNFFTEFYVSFFQDQSYFQISTR